MLGLNARVNADIHKLGLKFSIVHIVELSACDSVGVLGNDTELLSDSNCCINVVTRDHYRTDACASALYDSVLDLGTNGVYHTAKTEEAKAFFKKLGVVACRLFGPYLLSACKNSERLVCHILISGKNGVLVFFCHRNGLAVLEIMCALADNNVGSALGVLNELSVCGMNGGHHLSARVKGCFTRTGIACLKVVFLKSELISPNYESRLGGLTRNVSVGVKLGVAAKCHSRCKLSLVLTEVVNNGHLILSKRTRLIRADYLSAAESFNGCQAANYRVTLGHIGNADRENYGNNCRKSFGDSRNRERDSDHERIEREIEVERAVADKLNAEYDDADSDNQPGEYLGKLVKLSLERSLAVLCLLECACDLTHFGIHTRSGNDCRASAVYNGRAHIKHILTVAERNVLLAFLEIDYINKLSNGNGFTRQCRLFYLKACVFKYTRICRNCIACLEKNDVTNNEILAVNYLNLAVAKNLRGRRRHLLKSLDRLLCLALLINAENSVYDDYGENDDNVGKALALAGMVDALVNRKSTADSRRDQKNNGHRISELLKEASNQGFALCRREHVLSVRLQALFGFFCRQTVFRAFDLF